MALPLWNSEVYGKVALVLDQTNKIVSLKKDPSGEFSEANVDLLSKLLLHFEFNGYALKSAWSPEGVFRAKATPILKSSKYGQPVLHWLDPAKAPSKVTSVTVSAAEALEILSGNPAKAKAPPKAKPKTISVADAAKLLK